MESASKLNHQWCAMGNYRNSPFVTGSSSMSENFTWNEYGVKTEIFDYRANQWNRADDYPFSTGDRFTVINFYHILF